MKKRLPKYYLEEYSKAYPFRYFVLIYFFCTGITYIALKIALSIVGLQLASGVSELLIITCASFMWSLTDLGIQIRKRSNDGLKGSDQA